MKVAFLDRDGVINNDVGYVYKIDDFEFLDGVVEALKQLQAQGFAIIVVTNQSGIGRGYYTEQDYQQLTQWYVDQLSQLGVTITDVFHCPHSPQDNCSCRKPLPGLFYQAADRYDITFADSIMVGDKISDMEAGKAAGVGRCYLVSCDDAAILADQQYTHRENLFHCVQNL